MDTQICHGIAAAGAAAAAAAVAALQLPQHLHSGSSNNTQVVLDTDLSLLHFSGDANHTWRGCRC
jgi:hypothetical protein